MKRIFLSAPFALTAFCHLRQILKRSLILAALILSSSAQAALVEQGFYVTDTNTQTEYLKLSVTRGYSYNDVVVEDTLGLILAGWSLTSDTSLISVDATFSNAFDLIADSGGDALAIVTDESSAAGQPFLPSSISYGAWWESGDIELAFGTWSASEADPVLAVSLSRSVSAVPLPAGAWLFGSAIAGLIGFRAKRA